MLRSVANAKNRPNSIRCMTHWRDFPSAAASWSWVQPLALPGRRVYCFHVTPRVTGECDPPSVSDPQPDRAPFSFMAGRMGHPSGWPDPHAG